MKFELLKYNKIKVIIEEGDFAKWGISADEMVKNSPHTREIFFELLREAEKETGFSCNNARLVVETAVQANKSELTLFVTKVDNEEERALFDKISKAEKLQGEKTEKKEEKKESPSTMVELENFEDVIKMCYAMRECFWGSLYSYRDKYYMVMLPHYIPRASEFGSVCPEKYRTIIEEHAKVIIKNTAFLTVRNKFEE